jgi:thioredoxin 1|tara:strand:+ start:240 stop:428 length:189 start_codon:yes stop_codon:yes gene_type:complete
MLSPIMSEVNNTIPVRKVNIDEDPTTAQQYNVRSIPTVVLLENGQEVKRMIGAKQKAEYLNI